MKAPILGWDVGGANIKAARIEEVGQCEPTVVERSFPLWREPHRLPAVLAETADRLGGAGAMAVTMTAELADCFTTKREGVAFVLDAFQTAFPGIHPWIYGVDGRFRSAEAARQQPLEVAAANWMAAKDTLDELRDEADSIVCLESPAWLEAVGLFYDDFRQVTDAEVIATLARFPTERAPGTIG